MLENAMVLGRDSYGVNERYEPKQVANCELCKQAIFAGEEVLEFEDVILHDNDICISEYMRINGVRYIAK